MSDPIVDAIRTAVRAELALAIDEIAAIVANQPIKKIVDGEALSRAIDLSAPTIAKLRGEGMPVIRTGAVYRYDLDDVIAWMKSRSNANDSTSEAS